ncbi:MAG: hypothetical protein IPN94_26320 [Sphingobacteriales bacterium]|nr:hypothetical protein [Sphingobacteriales bacterium]
MAMPINFSCDALESMGLGDELDTRPEMLNESRPRSERISILEQHNVVFDG